MNMSKNSSLKHIQTLDFSGMESTKNCYKMKNKTPKRWGNLIT